jgi:hypothetical protein
VGNDPLTVDCLELASLEADTAYFERLSILVKRSRFEVVMARLELLADEAQVEYVSSKYVLTAAGRSRLVATRKEHGPGRQRADLNGDAGDP